MVWRPASPHLWLNTYPVTTPLRFRVRFKILCRVIQPLIQHCLLRKMVYLNVKYVIATRSYDFFYIYAHLLPKNIYCPKWMRSLRGPPIGGLDRLVVSSCIIIFFYNNINCLCYELSFGCVSWVLISTSIKRFLIDLTQNLIGNITLSRVIIPAASVNWGTEHIRRYANVALHSIYGMA